MQYTTDCQARYLDLQRDLAWVNSEAWKFEHPRAQQRIRSAVARILIALGTRLTPPSEQTMDQPHPA
jgi:hypothetical protein